MSPGGAQDELIVSQYSFRSRSLVRFVHAREVWKVSHFVNLLESTTLTMKEKPYTFPIMLL